MFGRKRPRCLLLSPREGDYIDVSGAGRCMVTEVKPRTFMVRKIGTKKLEDAFEVVPSISINYMRTQKAAATN